MTVAKKYVRTLAVFIAAIALLLGTWPIAAAPEQKPAVAPGIDVFDSFMWGVGTEADQVGDLKWVRDSSLKILTCWFNRHEDLQVFQYWRDVGHLARWQMAGYTIHVVTWEPLGNEGGVGYYHTSAQWLDDIETAASIFAGPPGMTPPPTVLWSLATEIQTFGEPDNVWNSQTAAYYGQLQANLLTARDRIKRKSPGSLVSLSWGGWQTSFDEPSVGGGLSMIPYFADTMRKMDFISIQAMMNEPGQNAASLKRNAAYFKQYNPHIMVAHWKPDNNNMDTLRSDLSEFEQPGFIAGLRKEGVFAMSIMDVGYLNSPDLIPRIQNLVAKTTAIKTIPAAKAGPEAGHPAWEPVGAFDDTALRRWFRPTGHSLNEPFLSYWTATGGLPVFGYPISEAHEETSLTDGKPYLVQYFERERLEFHPNNSPEHRIMLGLLGRDLTGSRADGPFARLPSLPSDTATRRAFAPTGQLVDGAFLDYWTRNGGIEMFGYPISAAHNAVSPTDGKTYLTQWFERARFEYHPELAAPYQVTLGLLGSEYLRSAGVVK